MEKINWESLKKRFIFLLMGITACMSCEEQTEFSGTGIDKTVEVSFRIGWAEEMDRPFLKNSSDTKTGKYTDIRSSDKQAFDYTLQPAIRTKSEILQPDRLYNLEIQQYDQAGNRIGGMNSAITQDTGAPVSVSLTASSDCQLVVVAWGDGNTTRLGTGSLSSAQQKSISFSSLASLDPSRQADMNKMPYVLHLKHVGVVQNGDAGVPGSMDGESQDIRLLLKRLAVRLELSWTYSVSGYRLNQILLQSIPANYYLIPNPDVADNRTYPSLLDPFLTIRLSEGEIAAGSYACWLPANVRGANPAVTSALYRTKSNAPTGSSYVGFQAVDNSDSKKKLDYRMYLGGLESSDFNLYSNTDYRYTIRFMHNGLPVDDKRVTIIDPIPASEKNTNLVPTANCFMVSPGGAFCFDPFRYRQEGVDITNSTLQNWADSEGGIAYVKLLWQTKENGDVGDPVAGVVNSSDDHTNIVDLKNGLVYCRIAPNTTGGSGLIAAYNSSNQILWSWHLWITDYSPSATGNQTVLTPANKRKLKFTNNSSDQPPMMDRNLGAMAGFTLSDPPKNVLDMSKANGFHYQWGRKDPFAGSYSAVNIEVISGLMSASVAPKGMLNRYGPDGISYLPLTTVTTRQTLRNTNKIPNDYIMLSQARYGWCAEDVSVIKTLWNDASGRKGMTDPCPAGWRVISNSQLKALSQSGSISGNVSPNASNASTAVKDGGLYLYFQQNGSGEASYFRLPGYRRTSDSFQFVGLRSIIWMREYTARGADQYFSNGFDIYYTSNGNCNMFGVSQDFSIQDGQVTRCIQEQE